MPINDPDYNTVLSKVQYWRSLHRHPLQIVRVRMDRLTGEIASRTTVAYRLKRLSSIHKKLNRRYHNNNPTMKLTQMQDIGGCRIVVENKKLLFALKHRIYENMPTSVFKEKNYITTPKADGYRCIHLIQTYKTSGMTHKWLNGLNIEIQLRTKLQHLWATAVETVDLFTEQDLKSNNGNGKWKEFFRYLGLEFEFLEENSNATVSEQRKELQFKIKKISKELDIINKMNQWANALKIIGETRLEKFKFFLLSLNVKDREMLIEGYVDGDSAYENYILNEHLSRPKPNLVLVEAAATKELRKAFPNYFADTKEFLKYIKRIASA